MGEAVTVQGVKTAQKTFTMAFSDSMAVYRRFVQSNPNLAFQLNFYWKHEGVKYPGRSAAVRDSLLDYFMTLTEDGMNPCQQMIYSYKHKVAKQQAILQLELEVVGAQTINGLGHPRQVSLALPDRNILYRDYDNKVEFATNVFADSVWLDCKGCTITRNTNGSAIARVTTSGREVVISVVSVFHGDTIVHGSYPFRAVNLPDPSVYLGSIDLKLLETETEDVFRSMTFIRIGYPPEIPLNVAFEVVETTIRIGDKTIVNKGKMLCDEYLKTYEEAEEGTTIVFESAIAVGPGEKRTITGPFKRVKKSPKGTKIIPMRPNYSKGC